MLNWRFCCQIRAAEVSMDGKKETMMCVVVAQREGRGASKAITDRVRKKTNFILRSKRHTESGLGRRDEQRDEQRSEHHHG